MSATPCGCECKAIDTVPVTASEGFAFVPLGSPAHGPADSFPLLLVLATVALALTDQRRRVWCLLTLRDAESAPRPAGIPWWKLRLSPAERRFAAAAHAVILKIGAANPVILSKAKDLLRALVREQIPRRLAPRDDRERRCPAGSPPVPGSYFFAGAFAASVGMRSNFPAPSMKNTHSEALSQAVVCR